MIVAIDGVRCPATHADFVQIGVEKLVVGEQIGRRHTARPGLASEGERGRVEPQTPVDRIVEDVVAVKCAGDVVMEVGPLGHAL